MPVDLECLLTDTPAPAGVQRLSRRRLSTAGRVSIVGESHYQPALARAAGETPIGGDIEDHVGVTALLVPEPENPHDTHAVRVDVVTGATTSTAGYLSRSDARRYQFTLLGLRRSGFVGTCPARLTGGGRGQQYGLYLHLAEPEALVLSNLTDDIELLEPERMVTVTREEDHQEVLAAHHAPTDVVTRVAVTLRSSSVSRGKHAGAYAVEVLLDGQRVGELTAAMSIRYRPWVEGPEAVGGRAACEAVVTHGDRGFQIDLRMPRASWLPPRLRARSRPTPGGRRRRGRHDVVSGRRRPEQAGPDVVSADRR